MAFFGFDVWLFPASGLARYAMTAPHTWQSLATLPASAFHRASAGQPRIARRSDHRDDTSRDELAVSSVRPHRSLYIVIALGAGRSPLPYRHAAAGHAMISAEGSAMASFYQSPIITLWALATSFIFLSPTGEAGTLKPVDFSLMRAAIRFGMPVSSAFSRTRHAAFGSSSP